MTSLPKEAGSSESGVSDISLTLDGLQKYLEEKLRISGPKKPPTDKVLVDFNLDEIATFITSNEKANIITLAGAGISTSAGIPDFRSPGSGLYDNLQKYNLPCPQAIFELDFFEENPKPFFVLAKELYPGSFKPTPSHYFIKLLEQKGLLLRHYTQNIDTLERVAGISEDKLVEAHGTFFTGHCLNCRKMYTLEWMKERIFNDQIPICESCPGVVKPDIVFFGENLPDKFYRCADIDFKKCDLLIIMGSSLVVQPFASLIDRVSDRTPRLLINREKVGQNGGIMAMLGIGGGLEFDSASNTRDVAWLGECDDGCQLLADKIGWGDELKKMILEDHKRIDEEIEKRKPMKTRTSTSTSTSTPGTTKSTPERNISSEKKASPERHSSSERKSSPERSSNKKSSQKTITSEKKKGSSERNISPDRRSISPERTKKEEDVKLEPLISARRSSVKGTESPMKKDKQIKGKPSSSKNGLN